MDDEFTENIEVQGDLVAPYESDKFAVDIPDDIPEDNYLGSGEFDEDGEELDAFAEDVNDTGLLEEGTIETEEIREDSFDNQESGNSYTKVLTRAKHEQWEAGNRAINANMEAFRDDLIDKGMQNDSEIENAIADERKIAQDELLHDVYGEEDRNIGITNKIMQDYNDGKANFSNLNTEEMRFTDLEETEVTGMGSGPKDIENISVGEGGTAASLGNEILEDVDDIYGEMSEQEQNEFITGSQSLNANTNRLGSQDSANGREFSDAEQLVDSKGLVRSIENDVTDEKRVDQGELCYDVCGEEDIKTGIANKIMQDYDVGKADFSDFDADVAHSVGEAIKEAKNDFLDLDIGYIGSIDTQVAGIKLELTDFYRQKFESVPNSNWSKADIETAADYNANKFIERAGLNNTQGTFAWSFHVPKGADPTGGGLSKYNGVAINKVYASDNTKFTAAKAREVEIKHKPIGCDTPRATIDHELGHEIDMMLKATQDPEMNQMYQEMLDSGEAENRLSGYAETSIKEFIAEGYAEYRNNPLPREYSVKVYQRMQYLYSQRRGE